MSPSAPARGGGVRGVGPGPERLHRAGRLRHGRVSPQDCAYGTEVVSKWKSLLENDQLLSHGGQDLSADAFHRY